MPDSFNAQDTPAEREVKKTEMPPRKEDIRHPETLALELAREWSSPGDWFHQHLYVE